jgi:DNA-binding transcriptional LysR family regulator
LAASEPDTCTVTRSLPADAFKGSSVQASLLAGKLVQVLPAWKPVGAFAEQLYAIRPYSAHVPRAVTAFVDFLRRALAPGFAEGLTT